MLADPLELIPDEALAFLLFNLALSATYLDDLPPP